MATAVYWRKTLTKRVGSRLRLKAMWLKEEVVALENTVVDKGVLVKNSGFGLDQRMGCSGI